MTTAPPEPDLDNEICRLYTEEDKSYAQIRKALGCTEWRIVKALDAAGVPRRPRGARKGSKTPEHVREKIRSAQRKMVDEGFYDPSSERERARREKISASHMGIVVTEEARAKIATAISEKWKQGDYKACFRPCPEERRKKISAGMVRAYREGRADPRGYYKNKVRYYKGTRMRSQSEVECAKRLDLQGVRWEYEPRRFDLGWCTYTPDFYLPDEDVWIEVKGWMTDISRRKIEDFRKTGRKITVLNYQEVRNGRIHY